MNINILDVEKVVIATLFNDFYKYHKDIIQLREEDFISKDFKVLFKTMLHLYNVDLPIDEVFLKQHIDDKNFNENSIIEIMITTPVANLEHYVAIIKSNSNKRFLQNEIHKVLQNNNNIDVNIIADIEDIIKNVQEKIITRFVPMSFNSLPEGEVEYYLKSILPIPKNSITMFSSKGGGAKTSTLIQLALRIASEDNKILAWFSEDPGVIIRKRVVDSLSILGKEGSVKNIDFFGNETIPFHIFIDDKKNILSEEWFKFKNFVINNKYKLIILDPLIAFYGGDENNNSQARYFMNILNELAIKHEITIILVHHHSKSDIVRGASAFIDAVRLHYVIEKNEEDDKYRKIIIKKDNWNVVSIIKKTIIKLLIFKNNNKIDKIKINKKSDNIIKFD